MCLAASDCDEGQRCQLGVCFDACADNDECAVGERCADGVCITAERCADNGDCPGGTVCEGGRCRTQPTECERASDCPPGLTCVAGACREVDAGGLECLTPSDCESGERCVDNVCVGVDVDSGTDVPPDAADDVPPDAPADVTDVPDATTDPVEPDVSVDATPDARPECFLSSDCDVGEICDRGRCVTPEADAGSDAAPDGPVCGDFLAECDRAADCCSGAWAGVGTGVDSGTCSDACTDYASCNPVGARDEWFCAEVPDGGTTVSICAPSDADRPCVSADTCLGGICLRVPAESACSWQCTDTRDCRPGYGCGEVPFAGGELLRVCAPIGDRCLDQNDCLSQVCLNDGPGTIGYCSSFCHLGTASPCPPGWLCDAPDPTLPGVTVCVLP